MSSEPDCRRAATAVIGESLVSVLYVGLSYDDPDSIRWDFGDWHWPEVGVQFTTSSGREFYAIWDSQVMQFEVTFAEGHIRGQWLPLQERDSNAARTWEVSDHPRWMPLTGTPIVSSGIALGTSDDPSALAPIAIRLATESGLAWLVAAAPRNAQSAHEDLCRDDVWLGFDELIVLFDDARAEQLGLSRTT